MRHIKRNDRSEDDVDSQARVTRDEEPVLRGDEALRHFEPLKRANKIGVV